MKNVVLRRMNDREFDAFLGKEIPFYANSITKYENE
jgi:hypothetical protein